MITKLLEMIPKCMLFFMSNYKYLYIILLKILHKIIYYIAILNKNILIIKHVYDKWSENVEL